MKPVFLLIVAGLALSLTSPAQTPQPVAFPISAKNTEIRRLLDQAWILDSDQVEQSQAIEVMKKILKIDPDFAMGHEILAQISLDPAEQMSEQKLAFAKKSHANSAEQTVIQWFQDAADHKLISAITNMNDVLHKYPHDRWLVFLANSWLTAQTQYERAAAVYENSGITDSPGLINNAAYTYANLRQFSKAFSLMDKYVALMPNDPNPQDSYAEILRMAGHYTVAIDHYRVALSMNPQFYSSQFGIADTYMLMGGPRLHPVEDASGNYLRSRDRRGRRRQGISVPGRLRALQTLEPGGSRYLPANGFVPNQYSTSADAFN